MTVAVRLSDLVSPLKSGAAVSAGDRSALAVAGTEEIRTGDIAVFLKVVAVVPAVVTRKGKVRAAGSPCAHATLGPLEEWLEARAGPGVIDGIAENAVPDERYVKAERERLLSVAFMIRVLVLQSLMPQAQLSDVIMALAGDLALVAWSKRWRPASERACLDWRKALGPAPLQELQQPVRSRDLSLTRARRLILAAIRSGRTSYKALASRIAEYRTGTDRDRHRARKSKSPSTFAHADPKDTATRIAPAVITLANTPA